MSKFAVQYRKIDGEYGTFVIEETGLCLDSDAKDIEDKVTRRYRMVALPNSSGAVLKVLDGTNPSIHRIEPSTYSRVYRCVKVYGKVDPYAPTQSGGGYLNHAVLRYVIRWQEVGGVS